MIRYEGELGFGVTAKDLILATIGQIGVGGATGHVVEYAGAAIEALSMEGRMTVCNMTIEGGGRAGMIAPDETTFAWVEGREAAPQGAARRGRRALAHAAHRRRREFDTRGRRRRERDLARRSPGAPTPGMVARVTERVPRAADRGRRARARTTWT